MHTAENVNKELFNAKANAKREDAPNRKMDASSRVASYDAFHYLLLNK